MTSQVQHGLDTRFLTDQTHPSAPRSRNLVCEEPRLACCRARQDTVVPSRRGRSGLTAALGSLPLRMMSRFSRSVPSHAGVEAGLHRRCRYVVWCCRSWVISSRGVTVVCTSDLKASTYDHRVWKAGLPVRSAVLKPHAGQLVVGWVTTSESWLLYVFFLSCLIYRLGAE
ncbi:hypothetical protein BJX96DRAFT_14018 [Aspergillus floccosus]